MKMTSLTQVTENTESNTFKQNLSWTNSNILIFNARYEKKMIFDNCPELLQGFECNIFLRCVLHSIQKQFVYSTICQNKTKNKTSRVKYAKNEMTNKKETIIW